MKNIASKYLKQMNMLKQLEILPVFLKFIFSLKIENQLKFILYK